MTERRYSDEEVQQIFGLAAKEQSGPGAVSDRAPAERGTGFTLAELQDIGREAGLEPERIAQAAASLEAQSGALPRRMSWGLPIAVGRTVELPRAPTDREWEMLVAELRNTFGARGRTSSQGNLREWSNGNLVAAVEPTHRGYELRLSTLKSNAVLLNIVGIGAIVMGAYPLANGASDLSPFLTIALGVAMLVANYVRMPRWADTREQQMEYIAGRFGAILSERPRLEGPGSRE